MDLLLDTICNTFGGVLFIALLVVMLVQTSPAGRKEPAQSNDSNAAAQLPRLVSELDALTDELVRLRAARSGQHRTLASLAPEEVQRLLEDRRKKEDSLHSLVEKQLELEAHLSRIANDVSAMKTAATAAKADLNSAQSEVDRLAKELAAAKAARVKQLRTPVAKQPGFRQEIAFVVQYGRLYLWHRYDASGARHGLNTEDFLVIGKAASGLETTPRPTRGIEVAETAESRRQLAALMRRFSPSRHYPAFVVRPDSYDEFEIVRDVAIELGFEYRLYPLESDSFIVDRGGSGGFVQ